MSRREERIRLWFDMWLRKRDLGIAELFAPDAVYIESWGPRYEGAARIQLWFEEWNSRGTVLRWEIRQFFHREDQTVVEWFFKDRMNDGRAEEFDGLSLIQWTQDNTIQFLKEFGCNINHYDPYQDGTVPHFREEAPMWF